MAHSKTITPCALFGYLLMDRLDELLIELGGRSREVVLQPNEFFDFNLKDQVVMVVEGDLLMIAPKDPKTGRSKRHTLKAKDPYGVAEAVSSKTPEFDCVVQTTTKLRIFDGQEVRAYANKARVFARTIIRYSLKRIFAETDKDRKASIVFEDDFIYANRDDLRSMEVPPELVLFKAGADADKMYFIEKGEIAINSEQNRLIALLGAGECFGEAVLLGESARSAGAVVEQEAELVAIDGEFARRELGKEHPITQFVTLLLLRQVGLVNQLRGLR